MDFYHFLLFFILVSHQIMITIITIHYLAKLFLHFAKLFIGIRLIFDCKVHTRYAFRIKLDTSLLSLNPQ
jgi:hypothetical protein